MLQVPIHTQPDDETCGPTSLQAVYQFYGMHFPLEQIIREVERSASGGTLAPLLGKHALQNGFSATLYVTNLNLFDPSWFTHGESQTSFLLEKLKLQRAHQQDKAMVQTSFAYEHFLELGGTIRFKTIQVNLLKKYFAKKIPILTALSSTYLYQSKRELFPEPGKSLYDDIQGKPCGHFVVLCGYDRKNRLIVVADPHRANPISHDNYYKVKISRLINAIMLGVLTFDANLLIIQPKETHHANHHRHR